MLEINIPSSAHAGLFTTLSLRAQLNAKKKKMTLGACHGISVVVAHRAISVVVALWADEQRPFKPH